MDRLLRPYENYHHFVTFHLFINVNWYEWIFNKFPFIRSIEKT